jgi:hypothetical protein
MIQANCAHCKKNFLTWRSQIQVGKGKYCSRACSTEGKKGRTAWNAGKTAKDDPRVAQLAASIRQRFASGERKAWSKGLKGEKHPFWRRKLPLKTRERISAAHQDEKHWNWKGGITDAVHRLRNKMLYQDWREKVLAKSGKVCAHCGVTKNLHCHHIKGFRAYPELRYDVDNGIVLCSSCHQKLHAEEAA